MSLRKSILLGLNDGGRNVSRGRLKSRDIMEWRIHLVLVLVARFEIIGDSNLYVGVYFYLDSLDWELGELIFLL